MRNIMQRAPSEFIFEYEDARKLPDLKKGQTFDHEGKTYRIAHYQQVFGEQVYCSFLVVATEV